VGWWYVVRKGALDWSPSGRSAAERAAGVQVEEAA